MLMMALPLSGGAQVNIESLRRSGVPQGFSGSLGGDLTATTGNVDFIQTRIDARVNWVKGRETMLVIGQGGLGFLGTNRFASSGLLHYRWTHSLGGALSPEWYAQVNYDRPQLLDLRSLVGAGVRTSISSGTWGQFGAGTSLMLEHERLDLPVSARHPRRTTTLRNSTFLTLRAASAEQLVVTSTTYAQPSLADVLGDLRVLEDLGIGAAVTERLDVTVTFDLRYDSGPPDGTKALDTRLRAGVTYQY
jgi:Protein of unknown function, DUF481